MAGRLAWILAGGAAIVGGMVFQDDWFKFESREHDREVAEALGALNDPSLQPIFVHCRLGKDRTGLVIALYRVLYQQWDACTAWKEWKSFGYLPWNNGLKNYFEERLRKETRIAGYDPDFDVGRCGR